MRSRPATGSIPTGPPACCSARNPRYPAKFGSLGPQGALVPAAFAFRLLATDGTARCGEITTPHGPVATPAFMPVGTQATVKGMLPQAVRATGADIVLGNTYQIGRASCRERV